MVIEKRRGAKNHRNGCNRTVCPETAGQIQEPPEGEYRVPRHHGQTTQGNARPKRTVGCACRLPRPQIQGKPNVELSRKVRHGHFQERHALHTAGVRWRRTKEGQDTTMGAIRAQALLLHVPCGRQAAGRRAPADIMQGRRIPPRNWAGRVRRGYHRTRRGDAEPHPSTASP